MKNRKNLFKWIIGIAILISLAFLIIPQIIVKNWGALSESYHNRMLLLYYSFSILGAIGTCSAVIIALFSEEIKMWLYKPDISMHFKDDDGYAEKVDDNLQIPVADSYNCILELEDVGFVNASDCSFRIIDLKYGKNKEKSKSIKSWNGAKKVNQNLFDISVDFPYELGLLSISNPSIYGTPASVQYPPVIKIYGVYLDDKYRKKGYWEIHYCLVIRNGSNMKYSIAVEWDGVFASRKTEMKDHLRITKI